MKNWIRIAVVAVVGILLLGGCTGREKSKTVVVSFTPQAWMLHKITGDSLNVVTLLPPGSDPESYQPSTSTLKKVAKADVWFTLGTDGFESALRSNLESNFKDLEIADCTQGIEKIYGTHEGKDSFDPHILSSVRNSIAVAENMTARLCELYPENAEMFKTNSKALIEDFKNVDNRISNYDIKGAKFVMRHPSLSYFARDYGLVQMPIEIEGKETTPMQLKQRIDEIEKAQPKLFIIDSQHANDRDRELSETLSIEPMVVGLNTTNWISTLERIAKKLDNEARQSE